MILAGSGPWVLVAGALVATISCERAPLAVPCPDVAEGDLVVTEVSRDWLELFNATGVTVDLAGAVVELQDVRGGEPDRIVVRSTGVHAQAGAYAALGRVAIDPIVYGYAGDFDHALPTSARLRLIACGAVIDEVVYWGLPTAGAIEYDGSLPPDAANNDDADIADPTSPWCVDETDAGASPGMANPPCGR